MCVLLCAVLKWCPCGAGRVPDQLLHLTKFLLLFFHLMCQSLKLLFLMTDKALHLSPEDFFLFAFLLAHLALSIQLRDGRQKS